MLESLKGKKTYVIVALFLVLVGLGIAGVAIPEYAYGILGALGLGFLRAGVQKISGNKGWKTYVAAIAVGAISILNFLGVNLPLDIIYTVTGAIGIIGIRDAVSEIGKS